MRYCYYGLAKNSTPRSVSATKEFSLHSAVTSHTTN